MKFHRVFLLKEPIQKSKSQFSAELCVFFSDKGSCQSQKWHNSGRRYSTTFRHQTLIAFAIRRVYRGHKSVWVWADRLVNKWHIILFLFFFLISSRWHNPQKQFRPFSAMANYLSMNQVQIWHAFRCIPFHANPTPFSRFQWAAWSFVHSCCGEIVSRFRLQALLLHAYFYSLRKYPQA